MNTGEVIIWCVAIVCATILLAFAIVAWIYKKDKSYEVLELAYKDLQRELKETKEKSTA